MRFIFLVVAMVFVFVGCSKDPKKPNIEVIQDMMDQPALKAQDYSPHDREKSSMRVPPKGSWPKNVKPYLYYGQPEQAAKKLKNPYANDKSEEFAKLGKIHFQNFCMVCHGEGGKGDGPVAPKFGGFPIPNLTNDKVTSYSDGRIFHYITEGKGIMKTYIHQLPKEKDRWAVVNYVRSLQKK